MTGIDSGMGPPDSEVPVATNGRDASLSTPPDLKNSHHGTPTGCAFPASTDPAADLWTPPPAAICPPEHAPRLEDAGVQLCTARSHNGPRCPLCTTAMHPGEGVAVNYCCDCELAAIAVAEHEGPVRDPWCFLHGEVTSLRRKDCTTCDSGYRRARRLGWQRPTGHEGVDCCHCDVCGLCKGTGKVCRDCWRCLDHQESGYGCEVFRWDPRTRVESLIGYRHDLFNPHVRRWAA